LAKAYDEKFTFLFNQLAIANTSAVVAKFVKAQPVRRQDPSEVAGVAAAPDDADLSD
jgi:hypothetical protein